VPLAEKVDKQKKFLWITTAIADNVLKDRNLQYTFPPAAERRALRRLLRAVHRVVLAGAL
jgi:hypothetical protein